jgi:transposase InsO family protein
MCKFLNIARGTYYYQTKEIRHDSELENNVIKIFEESRNNFGTRKIKVELAKLDVIVSRRKIARIMHKYGLVSNYTVAQFKVHKSQVNNDLVENIINRDFDNDLINHTIVSDLTYVRVGQSWHYVCILVDLFNREIIGHSCGPRKDAQLVKEAFLSTDINLTNIRYFHTDRGNEFKNKIIDEVLEAFDIDRSLSRKGNPYDNAVAEATFKAFKIEFIYQNKFESLFDLDLKLSDYINWFNLKRIHGSLGYQSPVDYRLNYSL